MKNNLVLSLLACFLFCICHAQQSDTTVVNGDTIITNYLSSPADEMLRRGDAKGAIQAYRDRQQKQELDAYDKYNFATVLAKDGQIDSAFQYLLLEKLYEYFGTHPLTDPDFSNLREDPRWKLVEDSMLSQIRRLGAIKNIDLAQRLWKMKALDQAYHSEIELLEEKFGRNSSVVNALWDLKRRIREENQKELEEIISKYGWPKISEVGDEAASSAFLIIQHADSSKQKKYLPVIKKLCEQKEAHWQDYALMYDRIQTSEGKPQKYGSQIRFNKKTAKYELFPLEDGKRVNEWRKEVGLGPLERYVASWGIKFETPK